MDTTHLPVLVAVDGTAGRGLFGISSQMGLGQNWGFTS